MRTLTGLSGAYVTFEQNMSKFKFGFQFLWLHLTGKIDGFYELTVLIVQFNESEMINLDFDFYNFDLSMNDT